MLVCNVTLQCRWVCNVVTYDKCKKQENSADESVQPKNNTMMLFLPKHTQTHAHTHARAIVATEMWQGAPLCLPPRGPDVPPPPPQKTGPHC